MHSDISEPFVYILVTAHVGNISERVIVKRGLSALFGNRNAHAE